MRRYALLIGCNRGKGQQPLEAAESDADRVRAMLLRHNSWTSEQVTLVRGDVTRTAIDAAIARLTAQLDAGDVVLVYYAGHAGSGSHADDYMLLLPSETYPVAALVDAFVTTEKPIASMLIIDACFSERAAIGAFMSFLHELGGRQRPARASSVPQTRVVIAASAADQPARENREGGIMTTALLKAAEHGGAQFKATSEGVVTIEKLKKYAEQAVGPRQQVKVLVYGSDFDVKTTLPWRLARGGSREYRPNHFLLLEERTRIWYASPGTPGAPRELVSAFWSGNPLTLALGFKGQPVEVCQMQQDQRTIIQLAQLPTVPMSRGIKVSPTGEQVAVASTDGAIVVYPANGSSRPLREYTVQASQLVLTTQGMLVTCTAATGELAVWPLARNDCVARGAASGARAANHMRPFPDGNAVVSGSAEPGQALRWDLSTLNPNARKVSPIDCERLLTEPLGRLDIPFGEAQRVAISPDGSLIAVGFGGLPGRVRIWRSGAPSEPVADIAYPEHRRFITALEFSADGTTLASGCAGGDVFVTPLQGGAQARSIQTPQDSGGWVTALASSPAGQEPMLAVGTMGGQVTLHDLATGQRWPLDDPRQRGAVYRLSLLTNESHPMQLVVAAKRGLECWDLSQ